MVNSTGLTTCIFCIQQINRTTSRLGLSQRERQVYNDLAAIAKTNIVLLSLKGGTHGQGSEHPDCYLNKRMQAKTEQVRIVCNQCHKRG